MKFRTKILESGNDVTDPAEVEPRLESLSAGIASIHVPDVDLQEREEALLDRLLPAIDENDPAWQAYFREKVQAALDDPRPSIPHEEVKRRIRERMGRRCPPPAPPVNGRGEVTPPPSATPR
jgi:hypothetical protein